MKARIVSAAAAAMLALGWVAPASAQIAGQQGSPEALELGRCVIGVTTGNDRQLVARWIGISLSMSPQLEGLVTVEPGVKERIDRDLAALFFRLFTEDCVQFARPLVQRGDQLAIQTAFGMLGEIAVNELMSDPRAAQAMTSYAQYVPIDRFTAIMSAPPGK